MKQDKTVRPSREGQEAEILQCTSDTTAQQWTGRRQVDAFRNFNDTGSFCANFFCKTSMVSNDGTLGSLAKVMVSRFAGMAMAAISTVPTQTYGHTFLQV